MAAKTTEWRPGPTVCRCCLSEGCYKDISTEYFWMGKREVYADMLSESFDLSISYSQSGGPNSHSRLICEPCISRLRDAADFKRQVQECERTFTTYLDPGNSVADMEVSLEVDRTDSNIKVECVKEEKGVSEDDDFDDHPHFGDDDDDDDYDDLDDQPLTKLASKIPKKESVEILELLNNDKTTEKRKSSTKSNPSSAKKVKTKKEIATSSKEKPERKKKGVITEGDSTIVLKDLNGDKIELKVLKYPINIENLICDYEDDSQRKQYLSEHRPQKLFKGNVIRQEVTTVSVLKEPLSIDKMDLNKNCTVKCVEKNVKNMKKCKTLNQVNWTNVHSWKQNALTIFEFSHVYPFIHAFNKYKCFVCAKVFLEAFLLKRHSTECHSPKDYIEELNNRVREKNLKVDVTHLQCKICETVCPNLNYLKIHLKDHGKPIDPDFQDNIIPFKLGGVNFQCQICDTTFLKLRLLVIHMSKHFNNYSCETCGAGFISLHLLKRHLQTHKVGVYPCEICKKIFTNSSKKNMHMRGVHLKQFPRTCPMCSERFNSNYQRTKHLRVVHKQSSALFKCETCGREYDLKYQLLVHIRSVHFQERDQECGICNSRFFSKYCLSRHMIIHTGEKNFKCDICGKAYARRKNLQDHVKSHELAHACSVCGREFNNDISLAAHSNNSHALYFSI